MRTIFQKWLLLNILIVFFLTFFIAFRFHTRQADKGAREMIDLKIQDTIENIKIYQETCANIDEIVMSDAKTTLSAFAEIIANDPSILTDQDRIDKMAKILDVEELVVSDEKGILIASNNQDFLGYDMNSQEQSRHFMAALTDPETLIYQKPQKRGIDGVMFQYVGRGRKDKPGIIQFGDTPDWYEKIQKTRSIENMASGFRIGTLGQICILQGSEIVSIDSSAWIGKSASEFGIPIENITGESGDFHTEILRNRLIETDKMLDDGKNELLKVLCLYQKIGEYTVIGLLPNDEMYVSRNMMIRDVLLIYGILFIVIFAVVSWLVDKIVIRGITRVNASLAKITDGDLNEQVNVRTNREFISLSNGINSTVSALKDAIAETAARIDKEIEFARAIQSAALPVLNPYPFANRSEFTLFAAMETAKGVGGDFYDFLMVDDDHLAVVIADVSGKGIPASLFMMKSKAVLRGEISSNDSTDLIMTHANDHLSDNNTSAMFVTAFLGILEISTGKFTATSAGHNAPVLIRRNQKPEYLNIDGGVILGAIPDIEYQKSELILQPGDRIYLYTDGVTEALNPQGELFGEDRLLDLLGAEEADLEPEQLLRYARKQLAAYAGGAPQSDDITMFLLEYRGSKKE